MKKGQFWLFLISATVAGWGVVAMAVGSVLTWDPPLISDETADFMRKCLVIAVSVSGLIAALTFKREHLFNAQNMFERLLDRLLGR